MTFEEKTETLIKDLQKRGVSPYTTAPPLFRLLWAIGLQVPPPFFLGFLTLTLLSGVFFGVFWGAFMWVIQWQWWIIPVEGAIGASAAAGLFFGLAMAAYYRWKAVKLGLPSWNKYPQALPSD
jgi:hypothetical protein